MYIDRFGIRLGIDKIGERIKITIERDGEEKTLVVKLGSKSKEA